MSGPLVGLVRRHGPDNHNAWAVLTVIAEDLHGPFRTAVLDNTELGRAARLGRTSVKTAVALLTSDGWVDRTPGRHTGIASTYRVRLERFPAEAVEDMLQGLSERGRHTAPVQESEVSTGAPTRPQSDREGSSHGREGFSHDPPTVRTNAVAATRPPETASAEEPHQTSLLLPMDGGNNPQTDDELVAAVLDGLPVRAGWQVRLDAAHAVKVRGWDPAQLHDHLQARLGAQSSVPNPVGLVRTILREDEPPTSAQQQKDPWPDWCGQCHEDTRMDEADPDHPVRCPRCYPQKTSRSPNGRKPATMDFDEVLGLERDNGAPERRSAGIGATG